MNRHARKRRGIQGRVLAGQIQSCDTIIEAGRTASPGYDTVFTCLRSVSPRLRAAWSSRTNCLPEVVGPRVSAVCGPVTRRFRRVRFNDGPVCSGVSGNPLALFPIPRGLSQLHVRCPVLSAFDSAAGTGNPAQNGVMVAGCLSGFPSYRQACLLGSVTRPATCRASQPRIHHH